MLPPSPSPASGSPGGDPQIGREIGPYRIEARLGEGGMGVVYRAHDTRLRRQVALKFLSPRLGVDARARDRLLQEARAIAALDHPHVATVYDVGETDDGGLFIAMTYYEGETLRQRLDRGPLAPDEAVRLGAQIARGLDAAHRAGIIHRDVKPANIMVVPEGGPDGGPCVKVLDFGIAKLEDAHLTKAGESLGTSLYMAPEQLRGEGADARTDIWGLGVTLYETLAGERPFRGAYAAAVGYSVLHEEPPPLPRDDLPDGLEEIVVRCLAKDPEARYASMADVATDLDGVSDGTWSRGEAPPRREKPAVAPVTDEEAPSDEAVPHEGGATPRRGVSSGARRWGLAVGGVVAVLALAWFVLRPLVQPGEAEARERRLVILPFTASGTDAEALADGLVEVVTGKLGRLVPRSDSVVIVPASEVEVGLTATEARERFGATLAIEGTVSAETDTASVVVSLVDLSGESPAPVDSREVGTGAGRLALQDAIALEVAELLRVQVSEGSRDLIGAGGTDDPEANAYYLRGRGHLRDRQGVRDLDRARALFAEAIALDPEFALAYASLAEAEWETYERTDDVAWADRARDNLEQALALDDRLPQVHVVFAILSEGLGEYEEALNSLDRALALDPDDPEALSQLGRVHSAMGHERDAEEAFQRAIAADPSRWRSYNSLGVHYLNEGDAEAAARQFRLALEQAPDKLSLQYNLGIAAWQQGDLLQARRSFESVNGEDPDHVGATFGLLSSRFLDGDYEGAVRMAERAVELLPSSYDARFALAEARWWADGQRDQAREDYRAALDLVRQNLTVGRSAETLIAMAGAFAASGQPDSARAYLAEIGRQLRPADANVRDAYAIGLASELAGDREAALEWFQSAFRRDYGRAQASRTPWLSDLRRESPEFRRLLSP